MSSTALHISVESYKRVEVVEVQGRVDSSNADQLDSHLKGLVENGRYNLVLKLSEVHYMSSAGLRSIVTALRECKKHGGDVRLAQPSERVSEVLSLAGLDSLFQVFDDVTAAVGSF